MTSEAKSAILWEYITRAIVQIEFADDEVIAFLRQRLNVLDYGYNKIALNFLDAVLENFNSEGNL